MIPAYNLNISWYFCTIQAFSGAVWTLMTSLFFPTAVDPEIIARGTVGFSGAELENLVNQAALKAAVDGKDMVTMKELEFSKDKILMGRILYKRYIDI